MLWPFDLRELNGEDLRHLPRDERKSMLAKLLKGGCHSGAALNEHLEADGTRAGIVLKRRDSVSGRSKTWITIKNPKAPGVLRFRDQESG